MIYKQGSERWVGEFDKPTSGWAHGPKRDTVKTDNPTLCVSLINGIRSQEGKRASVAVEIILS
jgi:hypothetical protein